MTTEQLTLLSIPPSFWRYTQGDERNIRAALLWSCFAFQFLSVISPLFLLILCCLCERVSSHSFSISSEQSRGHSQDKLACVRVYVWVYMGPPLSKMKDDGREVKERWEGNREKVGLRSNTNASSSCLETGATRVWREATVCDYALHGGLRYFYSSSSSFFRLKRKRPERHICLKWSNLRTWLSSVCFKHIHTHSHDPKCDPEK